jgi:hypothetical protein
MDKAMLEYRLRVAERRVTEGYEDIRRQRKVLADLTRHGDTEAVRRASELLVRSEDMQATRVIDRGRIVEELDSLRRRS